MMEREYRFEKDLSEMNCRLPVWLEGGPFDGAILFVGSDKVPVTVRLDEYVYRVDRKQFVELGDAVAYFLSTETT